MDAHPRTSSSDYVSQLDSRRRATAPRPLGPLLAGACACETVDLRASRPARSAPPQAAADLCCPPPLPDSFEASRARAVFRLNRAPSSARSPTHTHANLYHDNDALADADGRRPELSQAQDAPDAAIALLCPRLQAARVSRHSAERAGSGQAVRACYTDAGALDRFAAHQPNATLLRRPLR